jgi:TRAP-type mannitol/chloroaromatic compound transport system permease small subunit
MMQAASAACRLSKAPAGLLKVPMLMPPVLQTVCAKLDALNESIGRVIAWLTLLMVLVTFAVVVLRYAFDLGWIAMQESIVYMHAAVFLLGAAYTLKQDGHVRVDVLYHRFSTRKKALVDLIGGLLLLLPVAIYILWSSWGYVAESWTLLEASRETGGLPLVFLLKSLIPVMAGMLLLQGLSSVIANALLLAGGVVSGTEQAGSDGNGGHADD